MTDVTTTEASEPNKTIKDQPASPSCHSSHEQKPTNRYALLSVNDTVTNGGLNVTFVAIASEPKTYLEAMQSTHLKQWELAVYTEFAQLQKLGVFKVVDSLCNGRKAIGSRIVFREKRDRHSNLIKFKARIVAKGFSQIPGEDFSETFSSVAKFSTLRAFLSYVAFGLGSPSCRCHSCLLTRTT